MDFVERIETNGPEYVISGMHLSIRKDLNRDQLTATPKHHKYSPVSTGFGSLLPYEILIEFVACKEHQREREQQQEVYRRYESGIEDDRYRSM